MKTILPVLLILWILTACSPPALRDQAHTKSTGGVTASSGDVTALLSSLAPARVSQASQVSLDESGDMPQPLREVLDLAAQRRVDLAGPGGWLHIQTRHVQAQPDPLSPFTPGLGQYELDQWLALDGDGQVQSAIRKIMDESGKILQVSVLEDGIWKHLTAGAQSQAEAPVRFDPNYGFDELAARLVRQGSKLNKGVLYKECWYVGEKYTISSGELMHEAVFDSGYRELRSIKTWWVEENGDVSLVDSLEVMLEERAPQPPADARALLEQAPGSP